MNADCAKLFNEHVLIKKTMQHVCNSKKKRKMK